MNLNNIKNYYYILSPNIKNTLYLQFLNIKLNSTIIKNNLLNIFTNFNNELSTKPNILKPFNNSLNIHNISKIKNNNYSLLNPHPFSFKQKENHIKFFYFLYFIILLFAILKYVNY